MTIRVLRFPRLEIGLFLALGILWGSSYLAVKLAGNGLAPIPFVALRLAFAVAFMGAVAVAMRLPLPSRRELPHIAVVGLTGVVVPFVLITWAQRDIDAGLASIFNAATPLFTVLLAAVILRDEPLRPAVLAGLGLGLAGVAFVVGGGASAGGSPASMLAILLSALSYAVTAVYSRRFLRGARPMTVALGQAAFGLAATSVLVLALEHPVLPAAGAMLAAPPLEAVAAAAYLGIASSGVASLIFFRLIGTFGAGRTALVSYLVPVVGVVLGAVVLGERPGIAALAGGGLVVAGVAVASGFGGSLARRIGTRTMPTPVTAARRVVAEPGAV